MTTNSYISMFIYMSRNRAIRVALTALIAVILALIVAISIWMAAKHENAVLQRELSAKREQIYKQEQLGKLGSYLDSTLPLIGIIEEKLKSNSTQSDIMRQIGEIARQNSLQVTSQVYERSKIEEAGATSSTIDLRLSGRYADIRKMLAKIPAMSAWIEIAGIRIERQEKERTNIDAHVRLIVLKEQS